MRFIFFGQTAAARPALQSRKSAHRSSVPIVLQIASERSGHCRSRRQKLLIAQQNCTMARMSRILELEAFKAELEGAM